MNKKFFMLPVLFFGLNVGLMASEIKLTKERRRILKRLNKTVKEVYNTCNGINRLLKTFNPELQKNEEEFKASMREQYDFSKGLSQARKTKILSKDSDFDTNLLGLIQMYRDNNDRLETALGCDLTTIRPINKEYHLEVSDRLAQVYAALSLKLQDISIKKKFKGIGIAFGALNATLKANDFVRANQIWKSINAKVVEMLPELFPEGSAGAGCGAGAGSGASEY